MLKPSTLLGAFLLFSLIAKTQNTYEVISILGTVVNKTEKDTLKEASTYKATDKLRFTDAADFMGVVDQDGNTFMVMLSPEEDSVLYEPVPLARGGRPGKITNTIGLVLHFAEDTQYLILGDQTQIEFSPITFPMNADTFFYIRYQYNGLIGPEVINKQLSNDGAFLTLDRNELFKATYKKSDILSPNAVGDTILVLDPNRASDFEFRYYTTIGGSAHITFYDPQQPDDKQNRLFIPFKPLFLDDNKLVNEISILYQSILKSRPGQAQKSHLQAIKEYLENKYQGQLYLPNLEEWMGKQGLVE